MSKKIELTISGKNRPNLSVLVKKWISRKLEDNQRKLEKYYKLFPFLAQWSVDFEDVETILYYYGYIDKNGNVVLNPEKKKKKGTKYWDEEDYWDEYEDQKKKVRTVNTSIPRRRRRLKAQRICSISPDHTPKVS